MIEDSYATLQQLERGDLKLRVRALEAERALTRVAVSGRPRGPGACCRLLGALGSAAGGCPRGCAGCWRCARAGRGDGHPGAGHQRSVSGARFLTAACPPPPRSQPPPPPPPSSTLLQGMQKAMMSAVAASMLVNMGTVFRWGKGVWCDGVVSWWGAAQVCRPQSSTTAGQPALHGSCLATQCPHAPPSHLAATLPPALPCSVSAMATAASLSFTGAALLGVATLASLLKVKQLEKKEAQLVGGAA